MNATLVFQFLIGRLKTIFVNSGAPYYAGFNSL